MYLAIRVFIYLFIFVLFARKNKVFLVTIVWVLSSLLYIDEEYLMSFI